MYRTMVVVVVVVTVFRAEVIQCFVLCIACPSAVTNGLVAVAILLTLDTACSFVRCGLYVQCCGYTVD